MTLNDIMFLELKNTIEETSTYIANRLTMNALAKKGSVTLQEAAFFKELAKELLTEASDEIMPTTDDGDLVLTDQSGNEYIYDPASGDLTLVGDEAGDTISPDTDNADADDALATPDDINDPSAAPDDITESERIISRLLK